MVIFLKISLVIHLYNILPIEFIKLQESLINQTFGFHNIQIIIIDNCSVISESKNLISEFEKYDNVNIIFLDDHCTDYEAYKIGLSKVKTDYVLLFNSQDLLYSDSCELLYNEVNENNAEIVIGNYKSLKNDESNLEKYFSNSCSFSYNNIDYNIFKINFALGSRIYKKELLDDIFSIKEFESWSYFNFVTLTNAKCIRIINNMIIQLNGNIKDNSIINLDKLFILNKLIKEKYSKLTITIKTPNSSKNRHWGDYFYAIALKKAFEKKRV